MSIKTIIDCASGDVQEVEMTINELPTQAQINEQLRQKILNQLAQLDLEVPRIIEDIIDQGNFNIHESKLDVIAQKQALRQQLVELEV